MNESKDAPVLVVGGGLGGLGIAAALGLKGRRVHVIEQAPEIAPIGYGIQMGPNVFRVFDQLGVTDAVIRGADFPAAMVMKDAVDGRVLLPIELNSERFRARFGRPYMVIHRTDIHEILLDACRAIPAIEMTVGAGAVDYRQDGTGAQVICADGRVFSGAAVIGADGIRSRMRMHVVGEERPQPIGYVAHRSLLPMSEVPEIPNRFDVVCWAGPTFHVVHYPLRHGTLFNAVCVFKTDSLDATPGNPAFRGVLDAAYAGTDPRLRAIVACMNVEQRWVLADRAPVRNWSDGRITLLGDAAHPTLQSYAQGACMALEDAAILANMLEASGYDYAPVFQRYQKHRLARTARVQLGSRAMWDFYHCDGIEREVRDSDICHRTLDDSYQCLAWLWDGVPIDGPALAPATAV